MAGSLGSILSRALRLVAAPIIGNGPRELQEDMEAFIRREFRLLPTEVAKLRYVARPGSYGLVRIFDMAKAREQGVNIRSFRGLDRHPELVLCYGNLTKHGAIYLKRAENSERRA